MATEPDLAIMAAKSAIADVINSYCHIIDRRRWEDMGRCFHPDATYSYGFIDGDWQNFVTIARAVINPLRMSHHKVGNMLIRVDGDRADAETYFTAYHRVPADSPVDAPLPGTGVEYDIIIAGRYIDRFERRGGDWRIVHRTGVSDWRQDSPAADAGLFAQPPGGRGAFGSADPGFGIL